MVRNIVRDREFLKLPSENAVRGDMQTVRDLCDTLEANSEHCVGMAANMIGVNKRIMAVKLAGKTAVLINPVITGHSGIPYEAEEGCLSLIGTRTVKRYPVISVEYLDVKFNRKKAVFRGFEAQIIQHEADHFEGIIV
ncbi:MAG: peptide deformylase [Ruminococcus sp.]|nr:peptide deformylase [Ruminococcus sp.]